MKENSFITCNPTSGNGNGTINVVCTEIRKGRHQTEDEIKINDKSVTAIQFGEPLFINIESTTPQIIDANGGIVTITAKTNAKIILLGTNNLNYQILSLKYGSQEGIDEGSLKKLIPNDDPGANDEILIEAQISVPKNEDIFEREITATFIIQGDDTYQQNVTVTIIQNGAEQYLEVSPNVLYFNYLGVPCDQQGNDIPGATQQNGQDITVSSNSTWMVN